MSDSQDTLFSQQAQTQAPLAEKMRPVSLDEMVGQTHILTSGFENLLSSDRWSGLLFWGPPGSGKTTLARIIAGRTGRIFESRSAVLCGVKEFREVLEASRGDVHSGRQARILFIDEVHRLNKGQQDVLLPYLEDGSIRFIGATTENPSFEINSAICSRCSIFHLNAIEKTDLVKLLERAARAVDVDSTVLEHIADSAIGDARRALTLFEHIRYSVPSGHRITLEHFEAVSHSQTLYYDKKSESHYDTISAFIKSIRGSDPDAALYYLARMIEGGEDPVFIARRLIILAAEDIGNANPMALVLANNAFTAVRAIGMPEGRIVLGQATTYLACSEKSNRSYLAVDSAIAKVKETGELPIPMSLRNAPTQAMKNWGYGKGYQYAHNSEKGWVPMDFLPDAIKNERFYQPKDIGVEKRFRQFLAERPK